MKTLLLAISLATGLSLSALLLPEFATDPLAKEKAEVAMRQVGHRVLLAAGDSVSRVLPVGSFPGNTYVIRFESDLFFNPDTLVKVIRASIQPAVDAGTLPDSYVVNVLNCASDQVIYGYLMAGNNKDTLVPCQGRDQPRGCYTIKIAFEKPMVNAGLLAKAGGVALLLATVVGLVWLRTPKKTSGGLASKSSQKISIGLYSFCPEHKLLYFEGNEVLLTAKEAKLLNLFVSHTNQVLERNRLLKEVWEDEGVFVGRSPDVFISRLRKKLAADPGVNIVNVHGRGYKLEVTA